MSERRPDGSSLISPDPPEPRTDAPAAYQPAHRYTVHWYIARVGWGTDAERPRSLLPAERAWVALLPCVALTAAAVFALGPLLGHALFPASSDRLWPSGWWEAEGHAEPVKQGRYVLAALAPLALGAVVLMHAPRAPRLRPRTIRALTLASQALVAGAIAVALARQHVILELGVPLRPVFGIGEIVAAGAGALAMVVAIRRRAVMARLERLTRETPRRRVIGLAIAASFLTIWLLKVPLPDGLAEETSDFNLSWTLNDAFAVLDGRTPLVDYHVIYAKLLPFPAALALAALGRTALVYTAFMAVLDGLALLAVYGVFRRLTRSSLSAVLLFLPFVATSDINRSITAVAAVSPMTLSALWPMRYGGVYLLAWLTTRQLGGPPARRLWTLFLVAGLVVINNLEFGAAATLATVAALLCDPRLRSRRGLRQLAAGIATGALGAVALVSLLTLLRAGALPRLGLLLEWPRIFTRLGWFSLPLTLLGLHLALYTAFAAAIACAAVRLARHDGDAALTGMLAWAGVFGLTAGAYFIGRPDVYRLVSMLSAASFALSLIVIASFRDVPADRRWRPTPAGALVLFGLALSAATLSHLLPPQREIARLTAPQPPLQYRAAVERFIGAHARRRATVMILVPMSYRIAYDLGLRNVAPYAMENAIVTRRQMETLLGAARRQHVRQIFTPMPGSRLALEGEAPVAQLELLLRAGYRVGSSAREPGLVEFTKAGDRRPAGLPTTGGR